MFEKITLKSIEKQLEEQGFRRDSSKYEKEGEEGLTLEQLANHLDIHRKAWNLVSYDGTYEDIKDMYLVLAKGCEGQPNARYILYYRLKKVKK